MLRKSARQHATEDCTITNNQRVEILRRAGEVPQLWMLARGHTFIELTYPVCLALRKKFPLNTGGIEMGVAREVTIKDENNNDVQHKLSHTIIVEEFLRMVVADTAISMKRAPLLRTEVGELDYNWHNDEKTELAVDALGRPPPATGLALKFVYGLSMVTARL